MIETLTERLFAKERLDTWNDFAVKAAWSKDTPEDQKPFLVYAASKTEGERAAWKWVKEERRGFNLNTVLPNMSVSLLLPSSTPEMLTRNST